MIPNCFRYFAFCGLYSCTSTSQLISSESLKTICFQDSTGASDEGDFSKPGSIGEPPLEEAAVKGQASVKAPTVKRERKAEKAPSKKPKEGKGKVKSNVKLVEKGFVDQTAENLIKSGPVSECSTLQEESTISEVKSEVSKSLAVSQKSQQKSGKLLAKITTGKQPVKKFLVQKPSKAREKSDKKILAKPPPKVVEQNPPESFQCPLLHPPCSDSELCHCAR